MNPVDILLEMLLFILNSKSNKYVAMLDINIYIKTHFQPNRKQIKLKVKELILLIINISRQHCKFKKHNKYVHNPIYLRQGKSDS